MLQAFPYYDHRQKNCSEPKRGQLLLVLVKSSSTPKFGCVLGCTIGVNLQKDNYIFHKVSNVYKLAEKSAPKNSNSFSFDLRLNFLEMQEFY